MPAPAESRLSRRIMDVERSGRGLSPTSLSRSITSIGMEVVAGVILAHFGIPRPCCSSVSEAAGLGSSLPEGPMEWTNRYV